MGCGTLVQGAECVLFAAESGGLFTLAHLGDFQVGDHVRVAGCLAPTCDTVCLEGDGCIVGNSIGPCDTVCGGIAGIPCDSPDEFCKFPVGTCDFADIFGVCVPVPTGGCPEIYDPVCSCDGVTYSNECEADAAGVSIDHRGECGPVECAATRSLDDPHPAYCPGMPKNIHIAISAPDGTTAIALEDAPPAGWSVVAVSHEGAFDETNGKVKWGPFFPPFPPHVSYVVVPALHDDVAACFDGTISVDGINQPTCGEPCIGLHCPPFMEPDRPQPPCEACPMGDCSTCDDSSCSDGQLGLCEVIGYACGWKAGCNDDLAGMTRAAFVWRHGECYCFDDGTENWFPTTCPPPATGLCADTAPRGGETLLPAPARAKVHLRTKHGRAGDIMLARIAIRIRAPEGTSANALDFHLPRAWKIVEISDGGEWDEQNRKVKWGPFFDDLSRTVVVQARRRIKKSSVGDSRAFSGTVSFDGMNYPIRID